MQSLSKTSVLEFNTDTLQYLRQQYNLDKPGDMDKSIDILQQWINKQEHFITKSFDRDYLERAIILCKGSIERTKNKLDKICTYKTLLPKYFNPDLTERQKWGDIITDGILPKMTADHYRVYMLRNVGSKFDISFLSFYQQNIALAEYIHAYDYCNGAIIVYDCLNASVKNVALNMDIIEFQEVMSIIMKGYRIRIKEIHIMTSSNFVSILLSIIKQSVSPKLASRIYVHKSIEALYEYVPKDILPVEYGGTEKPLRQICDNLQNILSSQEFNDYLKKSYKNGTIEDLRSKAVFNDQHLGMPGSFRTFCVD